MLIRQKPLWAFLHPMVCLSFTFLNIAYLIFFASTKKNIARWLSHLEIPYDNSSFPDLGKGGMGGANKFSVISYISTKNTARVFISP